MNISCAVYSENWSLFFIGKNTLLTFSKKFNMLQMNGNKVEKCIKKIIGQKGYFLIFGYNYIKTIFVNQVYIP